jgi:hypothetical protein
MTNHELRDGAKAATPAADKYTGMDSMKFELSPMVLLCGAGGAIVGAILALWGTSDFGIVAATTLVMGILSGIFGMFL